MPDDMQPQKCSLLVYIPCHTDHERARINAIKIRSQHLEIQHAKVGSRFDLKIAISVNGANLSPNELSDLALSADYLHHFPKTIGGDTNINQGYLKALEINPDYFWILSANEFLVKGAISFILESINENRDSDLYVTNSMNRFSSYQTNNIFIDVPPGSGYGLISSVIYNVKNTHHSFSAGPRFAWTGWGQLAVIQTACTFLGTLNVTEFPDAYVYEKPRTDLEPDGAETEYEFVRRTYAHSFFGMVLLIYALFGRKRRLRNRVLLAWLHKNWFKIQYFKKGTKHIPRAQYAQFDTWWIQRIVTAIFFISGFANFLLYLVGSVMGIEKLRKKGIFLAIKRKFF